jgi:cyclic pyranopterin phosphate synthase
MPKEVFGRDFQFLPKEDLLTFEEIDRLCGIFHSFGVRKIRLTGGEPLVRSQLEVLVRMLALAGGRPDHDHQRAAAAPAGGTAESGRA